MRVVLKEDILLLLPDTAEERTDLAAWKTAKPGHVLHLSDYSGEHGLLHDLDPRSDACREAIDILFDLGDEHWHPISNLAETPFALRGRSYASVEGFWQGLKFADQEARMRIAASWGKAAKTAAYGEPERESFAFEGQVYVTGGPDHRALMAEACREKFIQHQGARDALLATGERPLTHRVRRDSVTIPGALLADIWMRLRAKIRKGASE